MNTTVRLVSSSLPVSGTIRGMDLLPYGNTMAQAMVTLQAVSVIANEDFSVVFECALDPAPSLGGLTFGPVLTVDQDENAYPFSVPLSTNAIYRWRWISGGGVNCLAAP